MVKTATKVEFHVFYSYDYRGQESNVEFYQFIFLVLEGEVQTF